MSTDWILLAGAVLVGVTVLGLGYFAIQRFRRRRLELLGDLAKSPVFADDRAHNQIRMARAELAVLQREGQAVPRAATLLDQAEAALARHENVEAVRLARNAHDLLVATRREGGSPPSAPPARSPVATPPPRVPAVAAAEPRPGPLRDRTAELVAGPTSDGEPGPAPADRPPKNRMEAHFQMTLLVDQLRTAGAADPPPTGFGEAERLRGEAQGAYAAGEFTEALRLSLRARRLLGARLETLPPGRPASEGPIPPKEGRVPSASAGRCTQCGKPLRAEDQFCRSCGASQRPTACPRCQAPVASDDTFCGRCGSPLA